MQKSQTWQMYTMPSKMSAYCSQSGMITGLRLTTIKIYIDKMFKPFQKRTSTFKSVGSFLFLFLTAL